MEFKEANWDNPMLKEFILNDFKRVSDYWDSEKKHPMPMSYGETCRMKIINEVYKFMESEECKTLEDLKNRIKLLLNTMNPS